MAQDLLVPQVVLDLLVLLEEQVNWFYRWNWIIWCDRRYRSKGDTGATGGTGPTGATGALDSRETQGQLDQQALQVPLVLLDLRDSELTAAFLLRPIMRLLLDLRLPFKILQATILLTLHL